MKFEDYWENYGELHASMCGGDIKQFAKEIWRNSMKKSDWAKWFRSYYGVKIPAAQVKKILRFIETDGGRNTWDYDLPADESALMVVQGSSKTFWAIPKPGETLDWD